MLWDDGAIKNEVLPGCAAELPIGGPKTHTFIADLYITDDMLMQYS